jgi:hypothetical protein
MLDREQKILIIVLTILSMFIPMITNFIVYVVKHSCNKESIFGLNMTDWLLGDSILKIVICLFVFVKLSDKIRETILNSMIMMIILVYIFWLTIGGYIAIIGNTVCQTSILFYYMIIILFLCGSLTLLVFYIYVSNFYLKRYMNRKKKKINPVIELIEINKVHKEELNTIELTLKELDLSQSLSDKELFSSNKELEEYV